MTDDGIGATIDSFLWTISELVLIGPFLYELIFIVKSSSSHSSEKSLAPMDTVLKLTLVALYAMREEPYMCHAMHFGEEPDMKATSGQRSPMWKPVYLSTHHLCTCVETWVPIIWWGRLPDPWFLTYSCFKKASNYSLLWEACVPSPCLRSKICPLAAKIHFVVRRHFLTQSESAFEFHLLVKFFFQSPLPRNLVSVRAL